MWRCESRSYWFATVLGFGVMLVACDEKPQDGAAAASTTPAASASASATPSAESPSASSTATTPAGPAVVMVRLAHCGYAAAVPVAKIPERTISATAGATTRKVETKASNGDWWCFFAWGRAPSSDVEAFRLKIDPPGALEMQPLERKAVPVEPGKTLPAPRGSGLVVFIYLDPDYVKALAELSEKVLKDKSSCPQALSLVPKPARAKTRAEQVKKAFLERGRLPTVGDQAAATAHLKVIRKHCPNPK